MGMYTEICINVRLSKNLPKEVLDALEYLAGDCHEPAILPDHEFFKSDSWEYVLSCSSHYFIPFSHTKLQFNEIAEQYFLCSRADMKNYDNEIEKFINWLMPYIDEEEGQFIGYTRYEEDNDPTLYFKT